MEISKFNLSGLHCVSCTKLAEKDLLKINDVETVSVSPQGSCEISANRAITKDEVKNALAASEFSVN